MTIKFNKKQKDLVYAFHKLFMRQLWLEIYDEITYNKAREGLTLLAKDMRDVKVICDETINIPETIDKNEFHIDLYFSKYKSKYKMIFSVIPIKSFSLVSFTLNVHLIKLTK